MLCSDSDCLTCGLVSHEGLASAVCLQNRNRMDSFCLCRCFGHSYRVATIVSAIKAANANPVKSLRTRNSSIKTKNHAKKSSKNSLEEHSKEQGVFNYKHCWPSYRACYRLLIVLFGCRTNSLLTSTMNELKGILCIPKADIRRKNRRRI